VKRRLRPLAALAVVALIGAGCGNGAAETGNKNATNLDKGVKFAECMRDNGVKEFPDPDASGALTIDGVVNGSSIDPDGPAWKRAIAACKDLQPSGFTGPGRRTPKQQSASLKFAGCIREHGVKDFPDPVNGQPLVDTNRIPSANRPGGMTILNAAMQTCRGLAAAAMTGRR
jgi:hypothetical protein